MSAITSTTHSIHSGRGGPAVYTTGDPEGAEAIRLLLIDLEEAQDACADEVGPTFPAELIRAAADIGGALQMQRLIQVYRDEAHDVQAHIEKLARFVQEQIPGEPSQSQGIVDTVVRLLTTAFGVAAERRAALEVAQTILNNPGRLMWPEAGTCPPTEAQLQVRNALTRTTWERDEQASELLNAAANAEASSTGYAEQITQDAVAMTTGPDVSDRAQSDPSVYMRAIVVDEMRQYHRRPGDSIENSAFVVTARAKDRLERDGFVVDAGLVAQISATIAVAFASFQHCADDLGNVVDTRLAELWA